MAKRLACGVFLLGAACLAACSSSHAEGRAERADGAALFAAACARCHGDRGQGGLPGADGAPAPRDLRAGDFQRARTDDELKAVIRNGKGQAMPAFGGAFDDAQLATLIATVRGFGPGERTD